VSRSRPACGRRPTRRRWPPTAIRGAGFGILVEVIDAPAADALDAADRILRRLDELGVTTARLPHGEEEACWPLVTHAGRLGLPTRIGMEDTTTGPTGQPVTDNAELVRLALTIWNASRR
jgi:hypothetical protein